MRRVIDRIQKKKGPAKKGRKKAKAADSDEDDVAGDVDDDDGDGEYRGRATVAPGQFENCVVCEKRFIVTPYTQAGKDGGLMCPQCTQDTKDDADGKRRATRKKAPVVNRQRNIRNLMTGGMARVGAQSLLQTCVNVSLHPPNARVFFYFHLSQCRCVQFSLFWGQTLTTVIPISRKWPMKSIMSKTLATYHHSWSTSLQRSCLDAVSSIPILSISSCVQIMTRLQSMMLRVSIFVFFLKCFSDNL